MDPLTWIFSSIHGHKVEPLTWGFSVWWRHTVSSQRHEQSLQGNRLAYYRLLLPLVNEAVLAHHNVPDEFIMRVVDCEQKLAPNGFSKTSRFYIITSPITAIINSPVRERYVPPSWKQTETLAIPKPVDMS